MRCGVGTSEALRDQSILHQSQGENEYPSKGLRTLPFQSLHGCGQHPEASDIFRQREDKMLHHGANDFARPSR